jgi:hypothetical protein
LSQRCSNPRQPHFIFVTQAPLLLAQRLRQN